MPGTKIFNREGDAITDWRSWVRPKEEWQWKSGRSAMECARAWFTSPVPVVPPEVQALLNSNGLTKGLQLISGRPEHETRLPVAGPGRSHDLALVGSVDGRPATVCVEAKADESFGTETIGDYWTQKKGTSSGVPARIEALLDVLGFGSAHPDQAPWESIGYQLLTASAGTVLQAQHDGADLAVLVVHEFRTTLTDSSKVADNGKAFAAFVEAIVGVPASSVKAGELYGPHPVKATERVHRDTEFLVGKAVYDWTHEP